MCGIAGWVDFTRDLSAEGARIGEMTGGLAPRGPDAEGSWLSRHAAIGHRRLAVIDIDGGGQPMVTTRSPGGGEIVLTYSGEIYNFRELRSDLLARGHRLRTRSDTEVVLHAYVEWGAAAVERMVGMFAFAVWDTDARQLLLVRDRLGVKPLYYHRYPGGLLFGSEPKAILANPLFTVRMSEESLPMAFNSRLAPQGATPLLGLSEVRPGHVLRFTPDDCTETRYWALPGHEHTDDLDKTVKTVRDLLEQIVAEQLVSDVPLGTLLSGGLDSSVVAALAAEKLRETGSGPLSTYSVEFANAETDFRPTTLRPDRDSPYAALTAAHIGADHREVIVDDARMLAGLPIARHARDLPSLGQFDASMLELFRSVRETSTVALSGEAADEVFGGYPWFHQPDAVWADTFPWMGDGVRLTDFLAPDVQARIKPREQERDLYRTLLAEVPAVPGESRLSARMREALYLSMQAPLCLLLDRKDRMSMAVGLEVRVPFCDHRLIEYVWNVPWEMKTADGREKSLLRMAFADRLPPAVLERPKCAYPASFSPGYAAEVIAGVRALAGDPESPLAAVLDRQRIEDMITAADRPTLTHANHAHVLIPLLEVDRWMRDLRVTLC
ncbi:asparagine synthase (glutamine-hydrolyzing) [Streptomyces olivaceiscleroticus]|uniref:asparagine synthase (glutamine-hydrolyzing) n=1 Tax=Streptomyces olivaceiscleroticus TaxID=68245 RepID=A0ABN1BDA5_9ACTN